METGTTIKIPAKLLQRIEEYVSRRRPGRPDRRGKSYDASDFVTEIVQHYLDSPALKLLRDERGRVRDLEKRLAAQSTEE